MALRIAALACVLGTLAACARRDEPAPAPAPSPVRPARIPVAQVDNDSNITRADYIGPDACGECHAAQLGLWRESLHRVMNARASDPGAVVATFSNVTVSHRAGTVSMTRDDKGLVMTTRDAARVTRYRVTRTIGHRGLQEYVGIELGHDEGTPTEVRLPFGWWPRAGGWQPQNAFDPWLDEEHFDAFAPVRDAWAERCPWCHSTYAFAQRIARASGPRAIGHGFEQYFTMPAGSERLDVDGQVTTGISCESCHLGGRAHAEGAPIQFLPRGATRRPETRDLPALPTTFAAQRKNATVINTVCAQCHSGPSPRLSDGTALRNSSEALDLAASPCTGLSCTDCHDPHQADGQPDEARVVATCARCHAAQAQAAHAGPGHAGASTCLDCHMPKIVLGIDRFVRTHRIRSPTNPALIAEAAPNACNLCHLDRSIDWTLAELRREWDARIALPSLRAYGEHHEETSVGDTWLASPSPAVRLVAAHAYARSPLGRFAAADIRKGLTDALPYVRMWTRFALEDIERRAR